MRFEQLPKWAQNEITNDILGAFCRGCTNEFDCNKECKEQCKQRAQKIAVEHGENDGYVLVIGLESLEVKLNSRVRKNDIVWQR